MGTIECPQGLFPELAGRRLFAVKYSVLDLQEVETIRQELARGLKYGITPLLPSHSSLLLPIYSILSNEAGISTQAWSVIVGANGTPTFYPERTGADELRKSLSSVILLWLSLTTMATQLQAAVRLTRTVFLHGIASLQEIRTQTKTMVETETGIILSHHRTATAIAEETRTRTAMIAEIRMRIILSHRHTEAAKETRTLKATIAVTDLRIILSLPHTVGSEGTRTRASTSAVTDTGIIHVTH